MQTFYRICCTMKRLPGTVRFLLVFLSFVPIELLLIFLTLQRKQQGIASLLVFTGILAALLFPRRTALAVEFALLLVHLLISIALKGWSGPVVTSFVAGTFADLLVMVLVGFLWSAWEVTEETKKKEQHLADLQRQFLMNTSHELRTPLTAVSGIIGLLRDEGYSLSEAERRRFLDEAAAAGNELERLVGNILFAVQVDAEGSAPWLRVFELDLLILDLLDQTGTPEHALHLDLSTDLLVKGDSQQVEQVLRNLLSNAFQYGPKGQPIRVSLWAEETRAVVCVQDQGPGIPANDMTRLFQKFSRLERDLAGPVRGIGLGLYISRKLIENMGGRIWVESTGMAGEGSRFFFSLPRAEGSVHVPKDDCELHQSE